MRYRLRTLLIVLAIGPPLITILWLAIEAYRRPAKPPDTFFYGVRY